MILQKELQQNQHYNILIFMSLKKIIIKIFCENNNKKL